MIAKNLLYTPNEDCVVGGGMMGGLVIKHGFIDSSDSAVHRVFSPSIPLGTLATATAQGRNQWDRFHNAPTTVTSVPDASRQLTFNFFKVKNVGDD